MFTSRFWHDRSNQMWILLFCFIQTREDRLEPPFTPLHRVFACVFVLALWAPCPGRWQIRWWQTFSNRVPHSAPPIVFLFHLCSASLHVFVFRASHVFLKKHILVNRKCQTLQSDSRNLQDVQCSFQAETEAGAVKLSCNANFLLRRHSRLSVNVGFSMLR